MAETQFVEAVSGLARALLRSLCVKQSANEATLAMLAITLEILVTDGSFISWYSEIHKDGIPSL